MAELNKLNNDELAQATEEIGSLIRRGKDFLKDVAALDNYGLGIGAMAESTARLIEKLREELDELTQEHQRRQLSSERKTL